MLKYFIAILLILPPLLVMTPLMLIMAIKPTWFSYSFRYKYIRFIVKWACIALRVDFKLHGEENIPLNGSFLITPNHQSFFDALSLIAILKRPIVFVAKKETKKMPYIGMILHILGGFFLDREDIRQSLRLMKGLEVFMNDNPEIGVVIFPEGTRTKEKDLRINEFKAGTFKVAYKTKTVVIPTAMTGTPRILSLKWYNKHRVDISFAKPLNYEGYQTMSTNDLASYCYNYSVNTLNELHKINDCRKNDE